MPIEDISPSNAPTVTTRDEQILAAAPGTAIWARKAGAVCAVVLHYIASNRLYLKAELKTNSIREYARKYMNIEDGPALTRAKHAGSAVKSQFPDVHEKVLDAVAKGDFASVGDLPPEYQLDLLWQASQANRGTTPETIKYLAGGVLDGSVNVKQLRECARRNKVPVTPIVAPTTTGALVAAEMKTTGAALPAALDAERLVVEATRLVEQASRQLRGAAGCVDQVRAKPLDLARRELGSACDELAEAVEYATRRSSTVVAETMMVASPPLATPAPTNAATAIADNLWQTRLEDKLPENLKLGLRALLAADNAQLEPEVFAARAHIEPFRIEGAVASMQESLNSNGYEIVEFNPAQKLVRVDRTLARQVFGGAR